MALRAFHNNPGIGGFGESTPILLDNNRYGPSLLSKNKNSPKDYALDNHGHEENSNFDTGSNVNTRSTSGDLLCQIIKELVDNAVDAYRSSGPPFHEDESIASSPSYKKQPTGKKRIRVDIRPPKRLQTTNLLQVTVTDNGCGMENIQRCVNPFHTTKDKPDASGMQESDPQTSGRYGIGLTLCLLHAQRCVPNSLACISSATSHSRFRTRALFKVDQRSDLVECVQEEVIPCSFSKGDGLEGETSGTCVSLLVPGGNAAKLAWPRLRDYFARFRLCPNLHFEIDVFAPTLSRLPIFVRPPSAILDETIPLLHENDQPNESTAIANEESWGDLLDDDDDDDDDDDNQQLVEEEAISLRNDLDQGAIVTPGDDDPERSTVFHAAKAFWPNRKIVYENVARSTRNIRLNNHGGHRSDEGTGSKKEKSEPLQLEVYMVVCPYSCEPDEESRARSAADTITSSDTDNAIDTSESHGQQTATLDLIRIVNGVPILDSTEVHSCGLVHGVANKTVWGSFGLDVDGNTTSPAVTISTDTNDSSPSSYTPTLRLRDSSLILPFINRNQNHRQLKDRNKSGAGIDNDTDPEERKKRKRNGISSQTHLLPANVRIGTILVVVQICASPSSLPLPTLSKGRLPLHHQPIDSTLQLCLRDCLLSLQSTNPALFLTTTQLRAAERDVRYIPAIASAVSRVVCRSNSKKLRNKSLELFQAIVARDDDALANKLTPVKKRVGLELVSIAKQPPQARGDDSNVSVSSLAKALECQLRLAIKIKGEMNNTKKRQRILVGKDGVGEEYREFDSDDETKIEVQSSQSSLGNHAPLSLSQSTSLYDLEADSENSDESTTSRSRQDEDRRETVKLPVREVVLGNQPSQAEENDNDIFDDWW